MPRKAFVADVKAVTENPIDGFISVAKGSDDGDVNACFVPVSGPPIEISLIVPDVSAYPLESSYMIFTSSSDAPRGVEDVLASVADSSFGKTVPMILIDIAQKLRRHLATGSQNNPFSVDEDVEMLDGEVDDEEEDSGDDSADGYFPGDSDSEDIFSGRQAGAAASTTYQLSLGTALNLNRRIKEDLRAVKFAGFKIGILTGLKAESVSSLVSISIKVKKLGLSDEAIQAWDLEPQQYIILLVRWSSGYKFFETIISEATKSHDVAFRIGVGNKYKPTVAQAIAAFSDIAKEGVKSTSVTSEASLQEKDVAGFSSMFISSSLDDFINSQFTTLLKIRSSVGVGWYGAKRFLDEKQGLLDFQFPNAELPSANYEESSPTKGTLPDIVCADHLNDHHKTQISFPLIAAQFALRYLTRCTEFCLVCHDKIKGDFEALKPYVCEKPLCLYQYMSLGFGPSVEHEILKQPYVVDLLVSFCYTSAINRRLREYPIGMSLAVPPNTSHTPYSHQFEQRPMPFFASPVSTQPQSEKNLVNSAFDIKYDMGRQEVIFEDGILSPVRNGEWVVITSTSGIEEHFRVEDVSLYPIVKLSNEPITRTCAIPTANTTSLIGVPATPTTTPTTTPPPPIIVPAKISVYNQIFDDMNDYDKADTIVMLLETLPSVQEMKAYLLQQGQFSAPNLRTWKDRISPAALGMLRWIIASNRSCIVQVDKCPGQNEAELAASRVRLDQRISNISESWVQFRFAQGSPDKEQRFLNALRAQQTKFDPKHPTIFAFHGSPLANWHSIIRTGLDFRETRHGRAFGHGVYHAMDQNTSVAYSQNYNQAWKGSDLKISSAMSVNEIVNCPAQFTSSNPFLVVQHIDWIQCRYLLVRVQDNTISTKVVSAAPNALAEVEQDPRHTPTSTLRLPIGIPLCAASISRAFRANTEPDAPSSKKRKQTSTVPGDRAAMMALGATSDSEEASDLVFMCSDEEDNKTGNDDSLVNPKYILKNPSEVFTDFVPGSLDQSSLPILDPPSYATPMATKALNRALQEILEIQKKTPLHELGWYMDPELINNVYQWIVELHSFDPELLLARDMKAAGYTSVVLEIRFGKDYPFSPPFVRVIRPRFLPFTMGGGGHVTAGGAMCMELLTNSGWSSVSSIEGILLQVRLAMSNVEPRPARLENQGKKQNTPDYGTAEAVSAFIRACAQHGWEVPIDFREFASAGPSG